MKKTGLQDMKRRNRQVIMEAVLQNGSMSRIEIANATELSPSTVTGLVSELLEDGLLVETGVSVSTGGRSRKNLAVNRDFGSIVVVDVGRKGSTMHMYDMLLDRQTDVTLADHYISGNELLIAITGAIFNECGADGVRSGALAGIGLLFQEDMRASDFNVMYSTSWDAANIPLKEALTTQFRVPIVEEYSQTYSITEALQQAVARFDAKNSAHIAIGATVLASVTVNGKPVQLKDGKSANITPLLQSVDSLPLLQSGVDTANAMEPAPAGAKASLQNQLAAVMALLCSLFPLDVLFLSGPPVKTLGFVQGVSLALARVMAPAQPPEIKALEQKESDVADALAHRLQRKILCP